MALTELSKVPHRSIVWWGTKGALRAVPAVNLEHKTSPPSEPAVLEDVLTSGFSEVHISKLADVVLLSAQLTLVATSQENCSSQALATSSQADQLAYRQRFTSVEPQLSLQLADSQL